MNSCSILAFSIAWFSSQFTFGAVDPSKLSLSLNKAVQSAPPEIRAKISPVVTSINSDLQKYPIALNKCREDKDSADTRCLEGNNKGWNEFTNMMGSMGDMASMSMSGSCSKLADLLKMGQGAQAGFRAQCAMAKSSCEETCAEAVKLSKEINRKLDVVKEAGVTLSSSDFNSDNAAAVANKLKIDCELAANKICPLEDGTRGEHCFPSYRKAVLACGSSANEDKAKLENPTAEKSTSLEQQIQAMKDQLKNDADENSPSSLLKACNDKAQVIQKTATNIMSLMSSMQQNQACADEFATFDSGIDLKNCALTGTCTPTDTSTDCANAKYKDSVYCKNYAGNNSGGTSTTGGGTNAGSFQDPSFDLDSKGTLGDLNMNGSGDLASLDPNDPNSPLNKLGPGADSKSAGVPPGGGGGGLSIPGGGYNPRGGGRNPSGAEGANYGASPSYAGSGNFGGSGGDKNKDDLQKYLPGAERDPALAKKGGPEGITASSGRTLFEKVSIAYKNIKGTLKQD